jgi:hypothetical protein
MLRLTVQESVQNPLKVAEIRSCLRAKDNFQNGSQLAAAPTLKASNMCHWRKDHHHSISEQWFTQIIQSEILADKVRARADLQEAQLAAAEERLFVLTNSQHCELQTRLLAEDSEAIQKNSFEHRNRFEHKNQFELFQASLEAMLARPKRIAGLG